ncbi:hypothetical protein ACQP3D_30975, partial [Escherichia coli]
WSFEPYISYSFIHHRFSLSTLNGKNEYLKLFPILLTLMMLRFLSPLQFFEQFLALSASQIWSF